MVGEVEFELKQGVEVEHLFAQGVHLGGDGAAQLVEGHAVGCGMACGDE